MNNLKFKKIETDKIDVSLNINGSEKQFSYIEMIKALLVDKKMEESVLTGDFTDAEKESIQSMVKHINKQISNKGN